MSARSAVIVFIGAGIGGVPRWQMGLGATRRFGLEHFSISLKRRNALSSWLGVFSSRKAVSTLLENALAFPWGTLLVNVSGSIVMGSLAALFLSRSDPGAWQAARLFTLTGALGGYTTFSAFSLETISLGERGEHVAASGHCLG